MAAGKPTSYTMNRRLAAAKSKEFSIVDKFALGYRNREDVTTLPPGVLIEGSQNVLTNTFQRVGVRKGYTLDGAANAAVAPIGGTNGAMGVFDWQTSLESERNMRAGFLTSAANDGKLQYRYVDASGNVTWEDLMTSLTSVDFNFITFWDTTNLQTLLVMANGGSDIMTWTGGVTTVASTTSNSISLNTVGTATNALAMGFLTSGTAIISGVPYGYTSTGNGPNTVYTQTSTNNNPSCTISQWNSQLFTTSIAGHGIASASVLIKSLGISATTAVLVAGIFTDNAGVPGTLVTTTTSTIPGAFSSGDFTVSFSFPSNTALPSTNYHLVVYLRSGGEGGLDVYTGNTGAVGTNISTNGGLSWAAQNGYLYATIAESTGSSVVLSGVTPDPSAVPVNSVIAMGVSTYLVSSFTGTSGINPSFKVDLLGTVTGRILIGSKTSSFVYIGNGASLTSYGTPLLLTNPPTAFMPQADSIYISGGRDEWYQISETITAITATTNNVTYKIFRLNTTSQQAAPSQSAVTKDQNSIVYLSGEPIINSFGPVTNIYQGPFMVDHSYSIVNLMNDLDFTNVSLAFFQKNIYVAVPREGLVLIYNMTSTGNPYWEAPQVLPIARFSIIGGELYGHSSQVSETYKLFTGYTDRATSTSIGSPINANWVFSYENYGSRFSFKKATKMFVEGYISAGDTLTAILTYELDACKTVKTFTLDGDDDQFVCISGAEGSLGKESLGKIKLGGDAGMSINGLPPKFRWFPTFSNTDFFEVSPSFSALVTGPLDILAFGLATGGSSEIPVQNYD